MYLYYDSKTGNVQRFINKLQQKQPIWVYIKIQSDMKIEYQGHLFTYTTDFGEIPLTTRKFLETENNASKIQSISSSGNMNWGPLYGLAADKISEQFNIPIFMKFELSGTPQEVEYAINNLEKYYENSKMDLLK
ncbi:protein involved in ribonucleotide reduction [Brevinema andersonii]|uniref:Protein involved in ribonucleotide reduction n=1 Tax=Brevinema andersonii TaxID=34097 RepID=A0A1I1EQU5_BREAD|nr:class Ib ribonucleoside-diphosphate reductase assembly flavoprotein NrdI [Brevinema andersonii]SFB89032.1 protein involved in ribonucleotide reduction [Brevinema andersonii]